MRVVFNEKEVGYACVEHIEYIDLNNTMHYGMVA
jgi:hypothetical protein